MDRIITNQNIFLNLCIRSEEHGFTALHWAAKDGRETAVDLLIARGANVHSTNMGEDTPLHIAATYGHLIIVQKV